MSYYEISTLIITVTSLVAFFLLYRAKELNLGILISISVGAITLGFTFLPVFKVVMLLLTDGIFINKNFAFIISVLAVLLIFLIFILIISFIISLVIPNKFAAIDCCVAIDNTIAKIKSLNEENKLKKPVDTEQKIDTMGIEKNEELVSSIVLHNVSLDNICATKEILDDETDTVQDISTDFDIDCQVIESNEFSEIQEDVEDIKDIDDLKDTVEIEKIAETQNIEEKAVTCDKSDQEDDIDYLDENVMGDQISENEVPQFKAVEFDTVENEEQQKEIPQISISESESQIPTPEAKPIVLPTEDVNNAQDLVLIALQKKGDNKKEEAIEYYMKALQKQPDVEMILWIVLDVCALYKQLGLNELAISILETLASKYDNAIKPEVKKEIMNCLI